MRKASGKSVSYSLRQACRFPLDFDPPLNENNVQISIGTAGAA
jgi:hypothetical protein